MAKLLRNRFLTMVAMINIVFAVSIIGVSAATAQAGPQLNSTDSATIINLGNLTPSQMEAAFPMALEDEAKIVHSIPSCAVIIDGVKYNPEQINLFDGTRLYFIMGKDQNLYAFTTAEGLEKFQGEFAHEASATGSTPSYFYKDIWYLGDNLALAPGTGFPYLYEGGFDNCVSSVRATSSASWTYLYDYTNFQGDVFAMEGGSSHSMLTFEGWNDRASSAYVSSY